MTETSLIDLEVDILDRNQGQIRSPSSKASGRPRLSPELVGELKHLKLHQTHEYGSRLFEALLPTGDPMRALYRRTLNSAKSRIRFKLSLAHATPRELHSLRWETLHDPDAELSLARSPRTAFSRYAPIGLDTALPAIGKPKLLIAIVAPLNSNQFGLPLIDLESTMGELNEVLTPFRGQIIWDFLEPPATAEHLRHRLTVAPWHILHLVGHSFLHQGTAKGTMVMESPDRTCDFVEEDLFSEVFLGAQNLRLLNLLSCHGGVATAANPFSGLGRRLVRKGVPAVISMQDSLSFQTAEEFPRHFYQQLLHSGYVDLALNETRHRLYLNDPNSSRWTDPVLFMRLQEGQVCSPQRGSKPERSLHGKNSVTPGKQTPTLTQATDAGSGLSIAMENAHVQQQFVASRQNFGDINAISPKKT